MVALLLLPPLALLGKEQISSQPSPEKGLSVLKGPSPAAINLPGSFFLLSPFLKWGAPYKTLANS